MLEERTECPVRVISGSRSLARDVCFALKSGHPILYLTHPAAVGNVIPIVIPAGPGNLYFDLACVLPVTAIRDKLDTVGTGLWSQKLGGLHAFADYDFADIKGEPTNPWSGLGGREKMSSQWAIGGRVGATITPNLLVYFVGGYTEAKFDRLDLFAKTINNIAGLPTGADAGVYVAGQTYKGWFLGAGDEYALSVLPGLFWKTEYRLSELDLVTKRTYFTATNAYTGVDEDTKKYVHTVRSELVYRFNWGGAGRY